jgi:hypothetical protein
MKKVEICNDPSGLQEYTYDYCSPERKKALEDKSIIYDQFKSDVFSLGLTYLRVEK